MATGGIDEETPILKHTDDRDEDEDENDEQNKNPFQPVGSSTPGRQGESVQMKTFTNEKSGLPDTSYTEETSFGGKGITKKGITKKGIKDIETRLAALRNQTTGLIATSRVGLRDKVLSEEYKVKEIQKVKDFIKKGYPNADLSKLKIQFSDDKKKFMDIVVIGPDGGKIKIVKNDGSGFRSEFLKRKFVQIALGKSATTLLEEENVKIKASKQALKKSSKRRANG